MPISLRNINSNFPSTTLILGERSFFNLLRNLSFNETSLLFLVAYFRCGIGFLLDVSYGIGTCSWHDHDADEIQQHADACIEGAVKQLEKAGWAKESVKVIGK
jgi:hypothetical protein